MKNSIFILLAIIGSICSIACARQKQPQTWSQVSSGSSCYFAIKTDSTLWAWGENYYGKLGLGDETDRSSPVQVGRDTNWNAVSCGSFHTLAIKTDGTLWAWGDNDSGELGLGHTNRRSLPTQVGTDNNWKSVSCSGYDSTLAIKTNGTLWAWGENYHGQLGLGDNTDRSSPVQVGSETNWNAVSCGYSHTLAIKTDGTLWAWGGNYYGQLGLGDTTNRSSPVQVGSETNWQFVSCEGSHALAIKTDLPDSQAGGTLWAWGENYHGQLGLGDATNRSSPVQVGRETNWNAVSCGYSHTLAIKTDGSSPGGTLWAWGGNYSGQLGLGDYTDRSSPVQVGRETNWNAVSCGYGHTLAIKTDGTLWQWGLRTGNWLTLLLSGHSRTRPVQVDK